MNKTLSLLNAENNCLITSEEREKLMKAIPIDRRHRELKDILERDK